MQPHGGSKSVNWPDPSRIPGEWTTKQRVHMEGPMALAAYVAEDGLVGHQWEEWRLVLARAGKWKWMGRWRSCLIETGRGVRDKGFGVVGTGKGDNI